MITGARPLALALLGVLLGANCAGVPSPLSASPGASTTFVASVEPSSTMIRVGDTSVTLGVGPTPGPGCSPTDVALRLQRFLAAFNSGDTAALATFFDRSLIFTEPNPPPIGFFSSHGPEELADYFAARHARHESRRLETLSLQYGSQTADRIDFGYEIRRSADDVNGLAQGKGLMSCASGTMSVWNMGDSR